MEKFGGIAEFVATVEAGSFAQAAQRLGMTPSGVGKAVSRLEKRLGIPLLRRSTRRLVVTEEGAECYQKFRQFLFDLQEMEIVLEPNRTLHGSLRLHLPPALARMRIMRTLPSFYDKHPNLTLHITLRNDMIDLMEEGVDLSVRIGTFDGANIISRHVGSAEFVTVCSTAYAEAVGVPNEPEELLQHNCLRYFSRTTGRPRKWVFEENDRQLELAVTGNLILNNSDALVQAAVSGLGIAQVPLYTAEAEIRDRQLIQLLEPYAPVPQEVSAIYSVQQRSSPKIQAFVDFLREALK